MTQSRTLHLAMESESPQYRASDLPVLTCCGRYVPPEDACAMTATILNFAALEPTTWSVCEECKDYAKVLAVRWAAMEVGR